MKRYINQEILSRILSPIPQRFLKRLNPTNLIIPYYHLVSDEKVEHVRNLYRYKGTREFTEDLDYLLKHFEPVSLGDVKEAIDRNGEFHRSSFHLTFDDGFREQHDIVSPILLRKGVPATFFVSSAFVDNKVLCYQHKASILSGRTKAEMSENYACALRELMKTGGIECADISSAILTVPYEKKGLLDESAAVMGIDLDGYVERTRPYLDSSQIRRLIGKGFTIGSHSIDHPLYANIGFNEQMRQTMESTSWLRETFGLEYGAFAFPHTERNVGERFFLEIMASGLVSMTFGTAGMINDELSTHLKRFSLENPVIPADRIIAMQYARKLWKG